MSGRKRPSPRESRVGYPDPEKNNVSLASRVMTTEADEVEVMELLEPLESAASLEF